MKSLEWQATTNYVLQLWLTRFYSEKYKKEQMPLRHEDSKYHKELILIGIIFV